MAIKNKDINIMVEVEELLHEKLIETNEVGENNKNWEIWTQYWNVVERFIQEKQKASDRTNKWNKSNRQYHRITNNIYNNKKSGNKEKLAYWKQELEKLKNS